jgi:predicted transcriptional regulator
VTDRATFTIRLDPALVEALDHERAGKHQSRNWMIEQAVRDFLNRPVADDTRMNTSGDARGASAEGFGERTRRGRSKREASQAAETAPADGAGVDARTPQNAPQGPAGPHRHRFTAEVPGKRRGVQGVIYATYRCDDSDCGQTLERKAPK